MKRKNIYRGATLGALLISQGIFIDASHAAIPLTHDCESGIAGSLSEFFTCGSVSGSLRTLYYSTHNAYFVSGLSQDTVSYGGSVKYATAEYYGVSLGVSGILQRGISHNDDHLVNELGPNQTGVGEAWLSWHYDQFRITAGDQRINIPFIGDYDWRITPILFRAIDASYGDSDNFLHATKITRYKPWGDDRFLDTTAYTDIEQSTNGMWGVGGGRSISFGDRKVNAQMWYENYDDYTRIVYADSFLSWNEYAAAPKIGLQFIRGLSEGKALAGEVNSTSYGAQFSMKLAPSLAWTLNYNHIAANGNAYGNGALVTPYAHNTSSGPYFAQPFFTSTQDLGSGNAYSTDLNWAATEQVSLGSRYSVMDLTPAAGASSSHQSEYLIYGTYRFGGVLNGLSLTDFAGVQTNSTSDKNFWQNRLALQYDF